MTRNRPCRPRPISGRPRRAWLLVVIGWAVLPLATIAMVLVSDLFGIAFFPALACVGVGSCLLSRKPLLVVSATLIGGLFVFAGAVMGTEDLAKNLWGTTAICRVDGVEQKTYTSTRHGRDSRGRNTSTSETRTGYQHQTTCPDGTHQIDDGHARAVGERVEVLFDPRSHRAEFSNGHRHQDIAFPVVLLAIGVPVILLLPFVAWRVGRRPVQALPLPQTAPPRPAWPGASPYKPWR